MNSVTVWVARKAGQDLKSDPPNRSREKFNEGGSCEVSNTSSAAKAWSVSPGFRKNRLEARARVGVGEVKATEASLWWAGE